MKYDLNPNPNWMYEAAILLSEIDFDRTEGLINNHASFGISKEEMIDRLSKYVDYKEAILPKIIPIYEKYPHLDRYFKDIPFSEDEHYALAPAIAAFLGENSSLNKDKVDNLVKDIIVETVRGFDERVNNTNVKLDSLEELLDFIDDEHLNDKTKVLLIDLFHNRYRILEDLTELLKRCVPICEEYFYIIKEDFDTAMELVKDKDAINNLLDMDASIKLKVKERFEAFVSISNFNGLSLTEGIDGFIMYAGIYFFEILKLKRENRFNDTQLIADLKALGDATRLKIIHLLRQQNMYVQELANQLDLTPATVSHHINVLLKSELITITLDTEKPKTIYYELNNEKLYSLGDSIKGLVDFKEV